MTSGFFEDTQNSGFFKYTFKSNLANSVCRNSNLRSSVLASLIHLHFWNQKQKQKQQLVPYLTKDCIVSINKDILGRVAMTRGFKLPVRILSNNRGSYYIGTFCNDAGKISKESKETWDRQYKAEEALRKGTWTQVEGSDLKGSWTDPNARKTLARQMREAEFDALFSKGLRDISSTSMWGRKHNFKTS